MSSILGEHISLIRPVLIKRPIIPKEVMQPCYNCRSKTRKIGKRELRALKEHYERILNDSRKVSKGNGEGTA